MVTKAHLVPIFMRTVHRPLIKLITEVWRLDGNRKDIIYALHQ